jgi:hypothetical protein
MRFNIHIKIERWKWSKKYGIWVSSDGRLKNKNKVLIKQMVNENGYMVYQNKSVHRIVMDTFKPIKIKKNMTVDHLDHNKRNNCLSNLEWVTKEENLQRAQGDRMYCDPKDCMYLLGVSKQKYTLNELIDKLGIKSNIVERRMTKVLKGPQKQLKYGGYEIKILTQEGA